MTDDAWLLEGELVTRELPPTATVHMTMQYHAPPEDYSPPTACEACGGRIIFGPVIGGLIWGHIEQLTADNYHILEMRPEGYFDVSTGETVYGNPLRRLPISQKSQDPAVIAKK